MKLANRAIDHGLHLAGEPHHCVRYDHTRQLKQCNNCFSYGHIGLQCKAPKRCSSCAGTCGDKCPVAGKGPYKCCLCHGDHHARSEHCPERKKAKAAVKEASGKALSRFPEKDEGPPKPATQSITPPVRQTPTSLTPSPAVQKEKEPAANTPVAQEPTANVQDALAPAGIEQNRHSIPAGASDANVEQIANPGAAIAGLAAMMQSLTAEIAALKEAQTSKPAARKRKADGPPPSSSEELQLTKRPRKSTTGKKPIPPKPDASKPGPRQTSPSAPSSQSTMPQSSAPTFQTPGSGIFVDNDALAAARGSVAPSDRSAKPPVPPCENSTRGDGVAKPLVPLSGNVAQCNSAECDTVAPYNTETEESGPSAPEHSSEPSSTDTSAATSSSSSEESSSESSVDRPQTSTTTKPSGTGATSSPRTALGDITNSHVPSTTPNTSSPFTPTPSAGRGGRGRGAGPRARGRSSRGARASTKA
ncbi:MAG: hypothetical protein LQ349_004931 [Xanthoria aureola]|nr:MAG: hypothetical protein LQ349_004931 [Xanthoria aureola]